MVKGGSVDPTRIAAQVVTGIGFLGAGAILRQGGGIRGLTTAATIWVAAAIGMAVGFDFYVLAIGATILVVIALPLMRLVRQRLLPMLKDEDEQEEEQRSPPTTG